MQMLMNNQLDSIDKDILKILEADSRTSQREIARKLNIAQGTVTNRIRKMENNGIIRGYSVDLGAEEIGWTMTVIAGLRIEKGRMIEVQEKISSDSRVFAVYDVTGEYDSMVLARVTDREDLNDLTKTVFTLDGITRSFTQVVLNTVKESGIQLPESN